MESDLFIEKKYFNKYKICLDGQEDSISHLIDMYMNEIEDKRVVLAIDAASVSSRISVSKDETIKGLLHKKWTTESHKKLASPFNFANFASDIIRYYFIVYICSVSPLGKSFLLH